MQHLAKWLEVSNEEHDEQKVIIQDGETPKEDFSTATNEASGDVDTAKPAVAELAAASEDDPDHKTTHPDGHLEVTTAVEEHDDIDKVGDVAPDIGGGDPNDEVDTAKPDVAHVPPKESGDDTGDVENDDSVMSGGEGTTVEKGGDAKPDIKPSDEGTTVEEGEQVADKNAEKVEVATEALKSFGKMRSSLEGFIALADKALETAQGLQVETAQAIRIGMEHIDDSFMTMKIVPSNESFGQTSSRRTATLQLRNGLNDALKTVNTASVNAQATLDRLRVE